MHDFEFLEPEDLQAASRMAVDLGEDLRFIAGGTALVLTLRQRMLRPSHLVSLSRLAGLRGISFDATGALRIGALTRHAELAAHPEVRQRFPMLADMAGRLANPQVRQQVTLGGNLCYADPAAAPPACLLALDARVVLVSQRGSRELALADFLVGYYATALAPDEILQEVRVPALPRDARGAYGRFLRTAAEHRPLVTVGVLVQLISGICAGARIAVGASVPVEQRLPGAKAELVGQPVSPESVTRCATRAAAAIAPLDDLRGSADDRRAMVQVQLVRTLNDVFGLARE